MDRFLPVGDFVQPTLLENWISAAFELFGGDPVVYFAAKKAMAIAVILVG